MPNIIGIPAGKMIRTSVNSDTDVLGLTRLTESYAFATSEFQTFRTRLINLTPYNTVMNYVYPAPATTYPYVAIDSVSIAEEAGGISVAVIQYLGILRTTKAVLGDTSWLPPAKQRLLPGNSPINPTVVIDFIYYSDSASPELDMIKKFAIGTQLPQTINGTSLYRSPVAPYQKNGFWQISKLIPGLDVVGEEYLGLICTSHFSERVGLLYKITNTYEDTGRTSGGRLDGTVLLGPYVLVKYGRNPV
jgi:hypothetical protein